MITRSIGALTTEDENGKNDKILGVPIGDPRFQEVKDITDVARHLKAKIADFFLNYKKLEPKKGVKVRGWKGAKVVENIILSVIQLYNKKFQKHACCIH